MFKTVVLLHIFQKINKFKSKSKYLKQYLSATILETQLGFWQNTFLQIIIKKAKLHHLIV